jgi:hypothetical protein
MEKYTPVVEKLFSGGELFVHEHISNLLQSSPDRSHSGKLHNNYVNKPSPLNYP